MFPEAFKELGEQYGDLYLMPSSVHEILATPVSGSNLNKIYETVRDINDSDDFVAPDELLGYTVYKYCAETGEISIAEKGKESEDAAASDRTFEVTEVCPHCESEITMTWDTDTMGFKAFCPVCGKRLMLCDECRHSGCGGCDYDSRIDSCKHNPPENA